MLKALNIPEVTLNVTILHELTMSALEYCYLFNQSNQGYLLESRPSLTSSAGQHMFLILAYKAIHARSREWIWKYLHIGTWASKRVYAVQLGFGKPSK